jgi:hypothetical protein
VERGAILAAMRLVATLVAAAALLVCAAPAAAVTGGFGIAKALKTKPLPVEFQGMKKNRHSVCEVADSGVKKRTRSGSTQTFPRLFAPVACEQPPRSTPNMDGLKHATAAALAVLG